MDESPRERVARACLRHHSGHLATKPVAVHYIEADRILSDLAAAGYEIRRKDESAAESPDGYAVVERRKLGIAAGMLDHVLGFSSVGKNARWKEQKDAIEGMIQELRKLSAAQGDGGPHSATGDSLQATDRGVPFDRAVKG